MARQADAGPSAQTVGQTWCRATSSSFEAWRQACFQAIGTAASSRPQRPSGLASATGRSYPWHSTLEPSRLAARSSDEQDAPSLIWEDHEETEDERKATQMCQDWKDDLFRTSPMVRFMAKHLRIVSCDPLAEPVARKGEPLYPRILITACPPDIAGGFSPPPPGAPASEAGILLCSNRMMDKGHMEDTLAHEMIHWWDHCRFKVNWKDIRHQACSEIRAASLSGDCRISREWTRRNYGFTKQHQVCTRRRAVLSIMGNENCKGREHAEQIVDEVWQSCFNDTRPFDEIY